MGVRSIKGPDQTGTWQELLATLEESAVHQLRPRGRFQPALQLRGLSLLGDDFSLLGFSFE